MSEDRFAWVGDTADFAPLLRELKGEIWTEDPVPDGWLRRASPAEAAARADFVFLAGGQGAWSKLLDRGVRSHAPPGACIVLLGAGCPAPFADELEAGGLVALDLTLLHDPPRLAVGGDRDTFNLLRPHLKPAGQPFFCGAIGAASFAAQAERRMLEAPNLDLAVVVADADARGFFPQALRNVWKAGPRSDPQFDAAIDALTKRV